MATIQQKKSEFAQHCKPENLVRCDYFSDTYADTITYNGKPMLMDITHISLPFHPKREKAVMKYYGLTKQEMNELYESLSKCISNQVNTCQYLSKKGVNSVLEICKKEVIRKSGRGSDVFILTPHLRPLTTTFFNKKTSIFNVLHLGTLLLTLAKKSNNAMVTIRVIDPEQIFVDNQGHWVFGCFQYAYNKDPVREKPVIDIAPTAPLHIHGKVTNGQVGDTSTDMFSIASIMWSLLNGDGFDRMTPTGTPPKYSTPEITKLLEMGMSGDIDTVSMFSRDLHNLKRKYAALDAEDQHNGIDTNIIPVPQVEPCIKLPDARKEFGVEELLFQTVVVADGNIQEAPAPAAEEKPAEEKPERKQPILPHGTIKDKPVIIQTEPEIKPEPVQTEEPKQPIAEPAPVQEPIPEPPVRIEQKPAEPKPAPQVFAPAEEEDIPEIESYTMQMPISRLDTSEYIRTHESVLSVESSAQDDMEIEVYYSKPKFLLQDILVCILIGAVLALLVHLSIQSHLFTLI